MLPCMKKVEEAISRYGWKVLPPRGPISMIPLDRPGLIPVLVYGDEEEESEGSRKAVTRGLHLGK
ncbi:hypothetical protein HYFRA_00005705 [Hymenoscyphus fraxineus]|uniref:Uncharacterized protein n=1 Tax=Hymenoscyphus fraxineus TaxID=746836 RepID=A0A9N9KRQ7_9HELO|nr:hypothetical protein HYFRA_00005705 [Hymenoscyphus fraxineus]